MEATPLNPHGLAILLITLGVFVIYIWDRFSIQSVSFGLIAVLVLLFSFFPYTPATGTFSPYNLFRGFGHPALVAICALMILGHALVVTGALNPITRRLSTLFETHPKLAAFGVIVVPGLASGFVNDTPIVVIVIPLVMGLALRSGIKPAGILMPMNFMVLVGGMATTIGTSTNLIVVSLATDLGLREIGMFDFYWMVAIAAVPAMLYLVFVAPRLLRHVPDTFSEQAHAVFEAQLHIAEDSKAKGMNLKEVAEATHHEMTISRIVRGEQLELSRLPTAVLQAGDRLTIQGTAEQLKEFESNLGAKLHTVEEESPHLASVGHEADSSSKEPDVLDQMIITQGSFLIGHSLLETHFSEMYGLIVVGLRRAGQAFVGRGNDLANLRLQSGDILLLQGPKQHVLDAQMKGVGLSLNIEIVVPRRRFASLSLITLAAVVLLSAFKLAPIGLAAVLGVAVLVAARCLNWTDISQALSTKVILLVVSSLALGQALLMTGGAQFIAQHLVVLSTYVSPAWFLALLMLVMGILTNFVSNNAAAAIGTPIAIEMARLLGAPPEAFVLAVLFGCNLCYLTPMGYQTNLLVMNSAGYRFKDFMLVGTPLFILMWGVLSWLLNRAYPM